MDSPTETGERISNDTLDEAAMTRHPTPDARVIFRHAASPIKLGLARPSTGPRLSDLIRSDPLPSVPSQETATDPRLAAPLLRSEQLAASGDTTGALETLCECVAIAPDSARAHNDLAVLYAQVDREVLARRHFERAYCLEPTERTIVVNWSRFLEASDERTHAKRVLDVYRRSAPRDREIEAMRRELARG